MNRETYKRIHGSKLARAGAGTRAFLTLLLGTAAAMSVASAARPAEMEEVVVTAQKREESLQKVPIAITAFTGDQLEKVGIQDTYALQPYTPGMVITQNGGAQIFIRGVGSETIGIGADPSTAVHVENVYITRPFDAIREFYDVERIEVLRGPQGTLYGRNATGGLINLIANRPQAEPGGGVDLDVGNYGKIRASAFVNAPVNDKIFARAALLRSQNAGYSHNLLNDRALDDIELSAGRAMLLFKPSPTAELLLTADFARDRGTGQALKVRPQFFPPSPGVLAGGTVPADPRALYLDRHPELYKDQYLYTAQGNVDLPFARLDVVTGWQDHHVTTKRDYDGTDKPVSGNTSEEDSKAFTAEARLSSLAETRLDWVAGLYYLHDDGDAFLDAFLPGVQSTRTDAINKTKAWAGFAQVAPRITDSLKVIAGVRYSHERKASDTTVFLNGAVRATLTGANSWSAWTPHFGLDFQATPDILVYAKVSRGFKSGGYNSLSTGPSYNPEFIWNYEGGFKSELLDHRARVNVSAFHYTYSDLQVSSLATTGLVAIRNAAKAHANGMELEIQLAPTENVLLTSGWAFLDAKFDDYAALDLTGRPVDASGMRMTRAPKVSGNIAAEIGIADTAAGRFSVRGSAQYQSRTEFSVLQTAGTVQGSYWTFDASALLVAADQNWQVQLYGRNLADKLYINSIYQNVSLLGNVVAYAPPRAFGVRASYRY